MVMTARGVTPDIVLADFRIVYFLYVASAPIVPVYQIFGTQA